jgi:serine/threonine protein kinase
MAKTIRAEKQNWLLIEKIGSGDAGEVWRVESETNHQRAVLKRPVQNVSGGTMIRQASQIEAEGKILANLEGIDSKRNHLLVHTPLLIDKSPAGTSGTSGLFIISEEVTGKSITSLLDKLRQGHSPFSQVLTLKVLAASFQLLRQVHAKGILWNDVKMDHIFWDETENKMSFIDWGNGLRFDPDTPGEQVNPGLDFQQLVNEGRQLLTQIAPGLIQDLAWPVSVSGFSPLDIFHLQMRVEYLESHLAMRVMEYQLLFDKYLESADDIQSLHTTLDLKKSLERLGVQVETQRVLKIAQKIWLGFLEKSIAESGYQLLQVLEENLPLPPHWQMASYFFKSLQEHGHDSLLELIQATLDEIWSDAMWVFSRDFARYFKADDATNILLSMRRMANVASEKSVIIPEILPSIQLNLAQNLNRLHANNAEQTELLSKLEAIQKQLAAIQQNWSKLEEKEALGEKLLNTREILTQLAGMGLNIPPNYQTSLTTMLSKTREIYRTWANAELDQVQNLLRELFALDPTLEYLQNIDKELQKNVEWVETLKSGPRTEQSLNQFGDELLASFPLVYLKLGTPGWLNAMYTTASVFKKCQDLDEMRAQLKQIGMPLTWSEHSSLKLDFQAPAKPLTSLNTAQEEALANFHKTLANNTNAQKALDSLKIHLPQYAFLYAKLNERVQNVWLLQSQTSDPVEIELYPKPDQARVRELMQVLKYIVDWRAGTQSRAFGFTRPAPQTTQNWRLLEEIDIASKQWRDIILPILSRIKQKDWKFSADQNPKQSPYPALLSCARQLGKLNLAWKNVEHRGIFPESLAEMSDYATQAQSLFYQFWQSVEKNSIAAHRWLAMVNQSIFSEINQSLLLIIRQLLALSRSLDVINNPDMARTRLALNSAGEIMFTLVRLNDLILPPSRDFNLYRHWRQQYLDLIQEGNVNKIRENIQSIESIHPLLPWLDELLRRDTDYFNLPEEQRW